MLQWNHPQHLEYARTIRRNLHQQLEIAKHDLGLTQSDDPAVNFVRRFPTQSRTKRLEFILQQIEGYLFDVYNQFHDEEVYTVAVDRARLIRNQIEEEVYDLQYWVMMHTENGFPVRNYREMFHETINNINEMFMNWRQYWRRSRGTASA